MNNPDVALAQLKFLLGSPASDVFCDALESYTNSSHQAKLSGK